MELSLTELKEIALTVYDSNHRKSLLPVLFAMNCCHEQKGRNKVQARLICSENKPESYRVALMSSLAKQFSIEKRITEDGKTNYVNFLNKKPLINSDHPDYDRVKRLREVLNKYHASSERVMGSPLLIFVYFNIIESELTTSKELKKSVAHLGDDATANAHRQLEVLERIGLIRLSRISSNTIDGQTIELLG